MNRYRKTALTVALLATLPLVASAQSTLAEKQQRWQANQDLEMVTLPAFQQYHPDERWLQYGLNSRAKGRTEEARHYLLRAARYASKPAQAMYALMLWQGEGGIADRAQAYAWMDLAAERGYPELLAQREQFWRALSSDERARAREIGESLYATYGDAVAKHRLERELRRGRFYKTGSRLGKGTSHIKVFRGFGDLGSTASTSVESSGGGSGNASTTAHLGEIRQYWDDRYWQPKEYWAFQRERWAYYASGVVTVKPLVPVGNDRDQRDANRPF